MEVKGFFCLFLVMPCDMWDCQFPNQGSNLPLLHWKHRVLTTELPKKSLDKGQSLKNSLKRLVCF